jgi:rod shape-determining protein MreC
MRNFLQQNWRTGAAALVVSGLILLALSGYLAPVLKVAFDPVVGVQRWLATRYLAVYELVRSPGDSTQLRVENERLKDENARLRSQLIQLQEEQKDNQVLYALLRVARTRPDSNYVAAMVIGRDSNPFMRYVLIDQGSDAGLRKGMPVITADGLVGRIDAVTASAARVQLITDANSAVNVRLLGSDADAMLVGSVTGDLSIEMVPQGSQIKSGDLVLTSGLGGTYPSNILVGQVTSVRKYETALFQSAAIQPATDFQNLRAVLVVTEFRPIDLTPLTQQPALP